MNVITIALIFLSFCGSDKAQSTTRSGTQGISLEPGELPTEGERPNEVPGVVAISSETEESSEGQCLDVILGASFSDLEGTRIQSLTTSNLFECCSACQEQERCTNWIRERTDGSCELYEVESAVFYRDLESSIDIGEFINTQGRPEITEVASSGFAVDIVGTAQASGAASVTPTVAFAFDCTGIRGVTYPNGVVIVAGSTRSAQFCCQLCRSSNDCNSWYYDRARDSCALNRNIPQVRNRASSRFEGGTAWN